MSANRRVKILELIKKYEVETQQQLVELLNAEGFNVTQATVSRDIRDLKLIKTTSEMGVSRYIKKKEKKTSKTVKTEQENKNESSFLKILKHSLTDVKAAENLIVIKTLSGCANAAAEGIDSSAIPEIIGTIAGDNTILVIIDKKENVEKILSKIKEVIA